MGDPAGTNAVLERSDDMLLANQIAERLASVFTVKGNVGHG
jgi:hypothetical protein